VGNYTGSIVEAAKGMGLFTGTFGGVIQKLSSAKEALTTVKQGFDISSAGATGFGRALIATGIGIIVLLLGALINGFSKLDPVMDKIAQLTAGFGAAMDIVTTTAVRFIENIKSMGDLLSKLGAIISNPTAAYKELTDSMLEAAIAAAELKEKQQELEDGMQAQEVLTARTSQQVRELILQSKNRSTSEVERQALLAKAAALDEADFKRRTELSNKEIAIAESSAKIKGKLSDEEIQKLREVGVEYAIQLENRGLIGKEEVDALKKATLSKIAILDESTTRQEKIQNQSDALEEKRIAKAEKARADAEAAEKKREELAKKKQDAIIKAMQEEIDLQDALSGTSKSESAILERYNLELKLLDEQLAQKLISQTKYLTDLTKLTDEFNEATDARNKKIAEEAEKFFNSELENYKKVQEEKIRIANEANDLATAKKEFDKQRLITDWENEMEIRRLQGEGEYTLRQEQLDRQMANELKAADTNGAQKNKIYEKYELAKTLIQKETQRTQLGMLSDGLGQVAELLGKNTIAGKAAGIAQATINTYLGVSQVLAAPPSGPEPLNTITKALAIATTIGTGIANVANIAKVPTKFAAGGLAGTTGGNLHSSGGTKYYGEDGHVVELEQGENWYVLNRKASRAIGALSSLNEYYGGANFSSPVSNGIYADGGLVSRSLEIPDISLQIAKGVTDGIKSYQPVVDVKDIITGVNNRLSLVDGANI
jgi:hypothetical protein